MMKQLQRQAKYTSFFVIRCRALLIFRIFILFEIVKSFGI